MNPINKNLGNIIIAAMVGIITIVSLVFQTQIQAWVNTHFDIVAGIIFVGMVLLFGEEFINAMGAIALYLITALGLAFLPLLLGAPLIVTAITMIIVSAGVSIAIATMPQGNPVQMFFHRRKLVVKLVSY